MLMLVASAVGQSSFTCPAAGDDAYANKPDLDDLNDAACNLTDTYRFTRLVQDTTGEPQCVTYCASCEDNVCSLEDSRVKCDDMSKCTLCADPPGCDTDDTSSARKIGTGIIMTAFSAIAALVVCY